MQCVWHVAANYLLHMNENWHFHKSSALLQMMKGMRRLWCFYCSTYRTLLTTYY